MSAIVLKQELVSKALVEMLDEGKTFGQRQILVYIDGVQFGPSTHTREEADEVFMNAVAQAVSL